MSIDSQLQLQDVSVVDVQFKKNNLVNFKEWNQLEENSIEYNVTPSFSINSNDSHNGLLTLTVTVFNDDYEEKELPFFIKVVMDAYFDDTNKDNEKDIFQAYSINMVSMIYPYVRSFISSLTATSGMEAINIPPINVLELLSQRLIDSKKDTNID